jgi:hypothetical protein
MRMGALAHGQIMMTLFLLSSVHAVVELESNVKLVFKVHLFECTWCREIFFFT